MAEINLKPQLRFPKFNDNWKKKRFDEIYSFKTTNSYSRDNLNYEKGTVKNIHYGDIHTKFNSLFDITQEDVPFINPDIDITKIADECYLKEADLVIADASENYEDIGKCIEIANLNNERVVAGLHTFLARKESDEMQKRFASFLMKTEKVRLDIKKIAQGTKVLSISTKRLAEIQLIIPEPNEQTKIANFLTVVDKRIALLIQKKKQLEQYKQGVMQKIFNQEIRFKDENGNEFPEWEEIKLGILGNYVGGGTPDSNKSDYWNGTIPWISSSDVNEDNIKDVTITRFITQKAIDNSATKLVPKNTLLIVSRVGIGKFAVAKSNLCTSQDFTNIIVNESKYDPYFLAYYFSSNKAKFKSLSQGTSIKGFTLEDIRNLKFPIPNSTNEQQKIASFLTCIDTQLETLTKQSIIMKNWKNGLLQKMFV